jgi:Glycosyl hydrolases family 43
VAPQTQRILRRSLLSPGVLAMLTACVGAPPAGSPPSGLPRGADLALKTPSLGSRTRRAAGNPILSDGTDYTTDPAPLVVDGTLYVLTGRDVAPPAVNDFVMPEWQLLSTAGDPMQGRWTHTPHFVKPEAVFAWALPGRAYAAQIVRGPNGRFYLFAPVVHAASTSKDRFAIGVAVADAPTGPFVDAHPSGPVVSQAYPVPNDIQNIDPTVLVDDDARVFLYWGTFGKLKGVELAPDMVTFRSAPIDVKTLTGFFEAPWIFKRNGTYYMAYASNTTAPDAGCTEAVYYACIAYGTAPTPLGPWTYRGVILDPVSSTTSHPGIVSYGGAWYLAYHTADARHGGHFRRAVALDRLEWDDAVSPARIFKVIPTGGAPFDATPTPNIASHARVTASNVPVPVQYWLRALNDNTVRVSPLPPDMWATWSRNNPAQQWSLYQWDAPVTINASSIHFWGDHAAGAGIGVAPPQRWRLEYWTESGWEPVRNSTPYTATLHADNRVEFTPITTRCLRAVYDASTDGATFAAVAAQEWQVFATQPRVPQQRPPRRGASATCDAAAP